MKDGGALRRGDLTMIRGLEPILPELGKIKIGKKGQLRKSKKGTDFQAPEKLDHFLITSLERGPDNNLLVDLELMKILAGKANARPEDIRLKELDIIFPYDDITLNFQTFYAYYTKSRCHCRGDGRDALRLNKETGEWNQIECDIEKCPAFSPEEGKPQVCKANGILSVILTKAPRVGGVYKLRTTSMISIRNLYSSMAQIAHITNGFIAGIPLKLTLKPQQVQPAGGGGSVLVYVVNIEWPGDLQSLLERAEKVALQRHAARVNLHEMEQAARLALKAAPLEEGEEVIEVKEEFYPEVVRKEIAGEEVDIPPAQPAEEPEEGAPAEEQASEPLDDLPPPPEDGDPGPVPPVDEPADDPEPKGKGKKKIF